MASKGGRKTSAEYLSMEEYRKAFFPDAPSEGTIDTTNPAEFGARLAREVLRKALEASERAAQPVKDKEKVKD